MPRRPSAPRAKAADTPKRTVRPVKQAAGKQAAKSRSSIPFQGNEQLVELCDLCEAARQIAEAEHEKLLAYLLAMAIQEGQTALRRRIAAEAGAPDVPPGHQPPP